MDLDDDFPRRIHETGIAIYHYSDSIDLAQGEDPVGVVRGGAYVGWEAGRAHYDRRPWHVITDILGSPVWLVPYETDYLRYKVESGHNSPGIVSHNTAVVL
jgi:hypothetical protein